MPGSDPNPARLLTARNVHLEKTGNYRAHRTPPRTPPPVQQGDWTSRCAVTTLIKDRGAALAENWRQGGEQRASRLAHNS
jgi:hypothetical protein